MHEIPPRLAEELDNWFTYHAPEPGQPEIYQHLRGVGRQFAEEILWHVPPGIERVEAVKHVRDAVMWANAGIACGGSGEGG